MDLVELFCDIDDFYKQFEPRWKQTLIDNGEKIAIKKSTLHPSEIMTIVIEFHRSNYRTFKHFYKKHVLKNLMWAFPHLVSYNRFVELKPSILIPLSFYLQTIRHNLRKRKRSQVLSKHREFVRADDEGKGLYRSRLTIPKSWFS